MRKLLFLIFACLLFASVDLFAAKRYWVTTTAKNWNTTNWSTTSGGVSGSSAPGNNDTAYFDGAGGNIGNCTLNIAVDVKRIEVTSGYSGTIVHGASTLTIGTGNASFGGGTFAGGSAAITVNGALTISGTAFTSTSNTLTVSGNFTLSSGSFTHNSGTTLFTASNTIAGTIGFSALTFAPGGSSPATHIISNTITANGTLTLSGGANALTLNTGTIDTKGNITITNSATGGGGDATVTVTGTATVTLTGSGIAGQGALPKVTINKSGGTLNLSSVISVANNWTWTAGTVSAGSSTVAFLNTCTIAGSHTLNNVTFTSNSAATYTISNTVTVNGTLTTGGSGGLTFNTGTLDAKGALTINNTGTGGGGSALVNFSGSGTATITGNSTVGQGALPRVTFAKSGGIGAGVSLVNTISIANNFTYTSGLQTNGTSTVAFVGTLSISGSPTFNNVTFESNSSSTFTIPSGTVTVNGAMTTGGSGALTFNTGTLDTKGNITLNNTGTGGGGTATLTITGTTSPVTLTGNSTVGQGALPKVTINKSSGILNLASTISVANNWTWTSGTISYGSSTVAFMNTLTIAGTHDLNNVVFTCNSSATYAVSNTLTVNGTFTTDGTGALTFSGGVMDVKGTLTINNTGTGGGGTTTLLVSGGGTVNFDSNVASNKGLMPSVSINKSGGTITLMDTISVAGNWSSYNEAYLVEGSSTVYFTGTKSYVGTQTLNNVYLDAGTHTVTSGDTVKVTGILRYLGTGAITVNTGVIAARGDIQLKNISNAGGGSAQLLIDGTAVQELLGITTPNNYSKLPNVRIKKTGGSLTLKNYVTVTGHWAYTSGTVTAHSSSTIGFMGTKTISGTHTLNKVIFSGAAATFTIASGTVITVADTLAVIGSNALSIDGDTLNAQKDVLITNSNVSTGGNGTIKFSGSNNQEFTGSGTAGAGMVPSVFIKKTGGTLTLKSIITCTGHWTYASGTVDAGTNTSTVAFKGSLNLDAQGTSQTMSFWNVTIFGGTRTLTGNVDIDNDLTIASTTTLAASSFTMYVGGNWNSQGTFTQGTSTVVFNGTSHNTIQSAGTVTFANLTVNRTYTSTPKSLRLLCPVQVNTAMTFAKGRVITTNTNYLRFNDNATCTVTNNDCTYVCGPVRKLGDDAFTFPLGDTLLHDSIAYHPMAMTAPSPSDATAEYRARYFAVGQSMGSTTSDSIYALSANEYWTLDRLSGTSAVTVTLHWNTNSQPPSISDLRVAGWNGTASAWADLGQASVTVNWPRGSITAAATTIFNSNAAVFTFAQFYPKFWGYATLKRKLDGGYYEIKNNALYFRFDDEYNDQSHYLTYSIFNAANTDVAPTLVATTNNLALSSYGDNRFKLDLWTSSSALPSGYYILEVRNEKNEIFYLRFKKS